MVVPCLLVIEDGVITRKAVYHRQYGSARDKTMECIQAICHGKPTHVPLPGGEFCWMRYFVRNIGWHGQTLFVRAYSCKFV